VSRTGPVRLTSRIASQSASASEWTGAWRLIPALFTRMPIGPSAAATSAATRGKAARSPMSSGTKIDFRPSAATSAATSSISGIVRAATATSAPARPSASAIALPIPRPLPVTSATRPSIDSMARLRLPEA